VIKQRMCLGWSKLEATTKAPLAPLVATVAVVVILLLSSKKQQEPQEDPEKKKKAEALFKEWENPNSLTLNKQSTQSFGTTGFGNTGVGGTGFGTTGGSKPLISTTTTTTKKPAQKVNLLDLGFEPVRSNTSSRNTSATNSTNTSLNLLGNSFSSKPVQQ